MGSLRLIYKIIYNRAKDETKIHWHNESPPLFLKKAVESLHGSGNALDVGCGTGVNSVFMAQQGLRVTAVDFIPEALEFARIRANKFGVDVEFVKSDVTKFESKEKFDLILDCGCLHGFDDRKRIEYKKKIVGLMSYRMQYVLVHFGERRKSDFGFGPRPKTKDEIEKFFMPELRLVDFSADNKGVPFFQYRFVRDGATSKNIEAEE